MARAALRCSSLSLVLTPALASYDRIASYEPGSDVIQHNRLDLDQQMMEAYLKESPPDFTNAKAIYNGGGHSGAYARMTLASTPAAVEKLQGVTQTGSTGAGYIKKSKGSAVTEVDVTYTSTCVDEAGAGTSYDISGCFNASGDVMVAGTVNLGAPTAIDNKYRTLAGFSTAAEDKMTGQPVFEKFKSYYTHGDYAHRYVTAALDGSGDFTGKAEVMRVEGAKKGSAYMNVWMYIIREMEDAVADCTSGCVDCNDDPVHAWDEGVAFYTGSLVGTEVTPKTGKMIWLLADKRCENFGTCENGNTGLSVVNKEIFDLWKQGQAKLLAGECNLVKPIMDSIVQYMTVPLVQGALRYAYRVAELQGGDKEKAEGAVFAAAVLPLVHSCDAAAATTISDNMKINAAEPMKDGFTAVKTAFESVYSCLGITCAHVGGLLLTDSEYYSNAEPCGLSSDTGVNAARTTAASGGLAMFALVLVAALRG